MSDESQNTISRTSNSSKKIRIRTQTQVNKLRIQDSPVGNYPEEGDSTSSGGYGSAQNPWSRKAQRGHIEPQSKGSDSEFGLADPSVVDEEFRDEIQEPMQLFDIDAGKRLNTTDSFESRKEAEEMLKSGFKK